MKGTALLFSIALAVPVVQAQTAVQVWVQRYSGGYTNDGATAIAVDNSGNVIVTGFSDSNAFATDYDYATVAYSGAGVPLWTNRFDGPVHRNDGATKVAVDDRGNLFVTGYSTGIASNYDYATIAYSSDGVELWFDRYNGPGNGYDLAAAIAADSTGNVYVTGYSACNGTRFEYATIKYSAAVPLMIQRLEDQVRLSWTNSAFGWTNLGFGLQATPDVTVTFTNIPGATSPYTNPIIGAQQFFRLISN